MAAIFIDVEKTSNECHNGHLYKLHLGTPTSLIKFKKSFLTTDLLLFGSKMSHQAANLYLPAGVPQGYCLSPTLYSIYPNYIPCNLNACLSLFADDTVMFLTANKNLLRIAIYVYL